MRAHRDNPFTAGDRAVEEAQLDSVLVGFGFSYGLVAMVDGDRSTVRTEAGTTGSGARVLEAVMPVLLAQHDLLAVSDAREDERFAGSAMVTGEPSLISFLAALVHAADGSVVGMTLVADTAPRVFRPDAIGRMHLGVGVLEGQFADMREAMQAHAVQRALLPVRDTVPAGYEFDGCSILHGQITGAYFDWHRISEGRVGFGLTESPSTGVGAGMIAAATRSCLRSAALLGASGQADPADAVARTSRALADGLGAAKARVSLLHGVLEPATGEVRFVNAGLEPPLVLRAETSRPSPVAEYRMATGSSPLGVEDDPMWTTETITLGVGDTLVVASASAWAVLAATRSSGTTAGAVADAVEAWARTHPEYAGVAIVAITRTAPAAA